MTKLAAIHGTIRTIRLNLTGDMSALSREQLLDKIERARNYIQAIESALDEGLEKEAEPWRA